MLKAQFKKWYPTQKIKDYPNFVWEKELEIEKKEFFDIVDTLISDGYFVAMHHFAEDDTILVMVDITWFRQR